MGGDKEVGRQEKEKKVAHNMNKVANRHGIPVVFVSF